ncbi:NADPH:quinone reductase-like Zn-dependent oxidoreductase [Psychromicrobium silvestre]|uniref:NADPH:quinone reductase-like Zn-dependent oxidoreductase n=1 Tax=Psychromicrobium silvestre TaxID=1645614 RepID=A0A7Y9S7A9_9MICC|nr:NAD(P)-dependent alcohol dehydrogenase [Psychromicrobium silvestre]NYE94537.1 NADPH:quinone reductase-like Zn-dependent oxidoreductase [Psychromicrobium silvestre]
MSKVTDESGIMQAIIQERYGSAEVLEFRAVKKPTPQPDEVLIKVHAAGVDRGTWHLMEGKPYLLRIFGYGLRRPKVTIPGHDVAGIVEAVGTEVTKFNVGDVVFGTCRGSFAEYAVSKAPLLALMPAKLTFDQAAALPTSGVTALKALRDAGKLVSGQSVLIIGASGGVGSLAVQIATAAGAQVTGVCSTRGLELVRSLGAESVIDYTQQNIGEAAGYDLILDIAGGRSLSELRRALKSSGTLVIVGTESGGNLTGGIGRSLRAALLSPWLSQRLTGLIAFNTEPALQAISELVENGAIVPSVERSYPLAEASEAVRHLAEGRTLGKVVVSVVRGVNHGMSRTVEVIPERGIL